MRIEKAFDDTLEVEDNNSKLVNSDLLAKESELELEPELELELEQEPVVNTVPELEQDSISVYDKVVVEEKDCWGSRPKKEKEKKKKKKKKIEDLG